MLTDGSDVILYMVTFSGCQAEYQGHLQVSICRPHNVLSVIFGDVTLVSSIINTNEVLGTIIANFVEISAEVFPHVLRLLFLNFR